MAGADVSRMSAIAPHERTAVREIIDEAFISAFRVVMIGAAGLALIAAGIGSRIRAAGSDG